MFETEDLNEKIKQIKKFIKNDETAHYKVLVIHKGEYKTFRTYTDSLTHVLGGCQIEAIVATSPQFYNWRDNVCDNCVITEVGCIHMNCTIENKLNCAVQAILAKQDCYEQFLEIRKFCHRCEKWGIGISWSC